MTDPATCAYELDASLSIVHVDAGWAEFARANHADELVPPPGPLGQSALSCVADSTSALLYERLFRRVLEIRSAIRFPIRCDAPARRRYLEMTIEPRTNAGLRVVTTLVRVEERPAVWLLDRGRPRGSDLLRMRGWCKSIDVGGRWREVEDAVSEMQLFARDVPPSVSHGICPQCHERVSRALHRS